jgi:hypothetical protein
MSLRPNLKLNQALKEVKRQMKKLSNEDSKKPSKDIKNFSIEPYEIEQEPVKGTGTILVSGTTVHGVNTKFLDELKQNDLIIIRTAKSEESRKVILVLSDKSACINSAFPNETKTEYYIQKPPVKVNPLEEINDKPHKKIKLEDCEKTYEVRVKRGPWTYKVDQVKTLGKLTGEDLLNVRAQRVRDKFCWM